MDKYCDATSSWLVDAATGVIKKYANRKTRRHFQQLATSIRRTSRRWSETGKGVQVVDASTGEDITRVTLTQIIVEDAKDQPTGLAAGAASVSSSSRS